MIARCLAQPHGHLRTRGCGAAKLLQARFEQMPIARVPDPMRAREMTVVNDLRALWVPRRIQPEDDGDGFAPIGSLCFGIKKADVARQVSLIVCADAIELRGAIFEWGNGHGALRSLAGVWRCGHGCVRQQPIVGLDGETVSGGRRNLIAMGYSITCYTDVH